MNTAERDRVGPAPDPRVAELALRRLGFARVSPRDARAEAPPVFWVQESGVPRRTFPVYLSGTGGRLPLAPSRESDSGGRAIMVVPTDRAAEDTWQSIRGASVPPVDLELSILVLNGPAGTTAEPHWHLRIVEPKELLRLATGVVVGLFGKAQEQDASSQVDFSEMIEILRHRFRVDVLRSLGVENDEDALFLMYQLAQRYSFAPGDAASNLHMIVLRPVGPAARLPWFAA